MMQDGMMENMGVMMWGMGIAGLLGLILVVLLISALVKYLFFDGTRRGKDE